MRFKIKVTPEESKIVQEVLHKYDIFWSSGYEIKFLDSPYLFVNKPYIYIARHDGFFEEHQFPEITFNEFITEYAFDELFNLLP